MTGPAGERVLFPLDLNENDRGYPLKAVIQYLIYLSQKIIQHSLLVYTLPETINTEELTGTRRRREKNSASEESRQRQIKKFSLGQLALNLLGSAGYAFTRDIVKEPFKYLPQFCSISSCFNMRNKFVLSRLYQ